MHIAFAESKIYLYWTIIVVRSEIWKIRM